MAAHVEGQLLVYSTFLRYLFQQDICPSVAVNIEQAVATTERLVAVNDFTGTLHQLHTERYLRLLTCR